MAAAVFIPPSPHDPLAKMANVSRRVPLASLSNATNSPHRPLTHSGSKRPRSLANVAQQENEPPQKRLAVEKNARDASRNPATPQRQSGPGMAEGRVFERGNGDSGSTAFQRRLVAAREKSAGLRITKNVEPTTKEDSIRTWQKHYRRLFPTFSFYFDGVSEDTRARFLRQLTGLGSVRFQLLLWCTTNGLGCRRKKSFFPKQSRTSSRPATFLQTTHLTTIPPSSLRWKTNPRPSTRPFSKRTPAGTCRRLRDAMEPTTWTSWSEGKRWA